MRNTETHSQHITLFSLGANYDLAPEMNSLIKQGFYKDALNMRISNTNQVDYTLDRIKGEQIRYDVNDNVNINYKCIGVVEVNSHVVEIWCREDNNDVAFRIDGQIMLHDTDNLMKLSINAPLQIHKNDSCNGGEFYFVDNVNPPYIYSVKNIIDSFNAGSLTYFGNTIYGGTFNPMLYQVGLTMDVNAPVFRELVDVGSGGGLPNGQYSYSFRLVDDSGNRTNFSPPTPPIPVVKNYESDSTHYAYSKTYGGEANLVPTKYGIKIEFRVNNKLNYKYIEIGRVAWNTNQALGYVPVKQFYRMPIELISGEFSTRTFVDVDGLDWEDLLDDETTSSMGAIVTAKAIRYFNGQLVLGNITYASRDLDNKIKFKTSPHDRLYTPFIDNIGDAGHSDPYNSTYKKQYMSGERYGFGIACYDSLGNISLVLPIDNNIVNMRNVEMPNRRYGCNIDTIDLCVTNWKGVPTAADTINNIAPVHERYQFNASKPKTNNAYKTLRRTAGYSVLHPVKYDDHYSDHDYRINDKVCTTSHIDPPDYNFVNYMPDKFSPDIYTHGLAVYGVEEFPDWVSAFSIVRTDAAGRVVAQGISTYAFDDKPVTKAHFLGNPVYDVVDKDLDRVWFYSDDIEKGYASFNSDNDIQFVSPVAYFSEVYNNQFERADMHNYSSNCDIVLYANQFYTDPDSLTSPSLRHSTVNGTYWTKFGEWRSKPSVNPFGNNGNKIWNINSVTNNTFKGVGRNNHYTIGLTENIYTQTTPQALSAQPLGVINTSNIQDVNDLSNQEWHEPFYITNIINDGKNIIDNNINEYVLTGHFQKIKSTIGIGNSMPQQIRLVDERWQDCMVNYYSNTKAKDNRYIFIIDTATNQEYRWIDITYKSSVDRSAILSDLQTLGYHVDSDNNKCYGVYTGVFDVYKDRNFVIKFDVISGVDDKFTLPLTSTEITVRYDNRVPLIVFGGDSVIGHTSFAPIDGLCDDNGNVVDFKQLYAWTGFPYPAYKFNDNYKVIAAIHSATGVNIQDQQTVPIGMIRQMLVSYICESRSHIPYSYCEKAEGEDACDERAYNPYSKFPRVHYVMRPNKWLKDCKKNFKNDLDRVDPQYEKDYPGEFSVWGYGGFRVFDINNRDYSQKDTFNKTFSKPAVGFEEKTRFCSRVAWSLKRNINEQNDPNLKTFTSLNVFDISDSTQEIKYLYDGDSDKGNNLIALSGFGICLLLTNKMTISQADGNTLTYLNADKLVNGEYWLSKTIGCHDEFWRGCAEYNNELFFPNSDSVYKLSGLQVIDIGRNNQGGYFSKLNPALQSVSNGYRDNVCGVYDVLHNEYWLHINKEHNVNLFVPKLLNLKDGNNYGNNNTVFHYPHNTDHLILSSSIVDLSIIMPSEDRFEDDDVLYITPINAVAKLHMKYNSQAFDVLSAGRTYRCEFLGSKAKSNQNKWIVIEVSSVDFEHDTYVYFNSPNREVWVGTNDYVADKMLNIGKTHSTSSVLLMRDFTTYNTNVGNIINNDNVNGRVDFYVAPYPSVTKEFIDQTINTNQSPSYCYYNNYNDDNYEALQFMFKNYTNGFYTQIPRKEAANRYRFQGKFLKCRLGCDAEGDWSISTVETGLKLIR